MALVRTSLGAYAHAQILRRVDEFLAVLRPARELVEHHHHLDEDLVHDLRVANRRLREAVRVFRPLALKRRRGTVDQLKALMDAAGAVRNCDIASKLCAVDLPDDRAAAMAELERRVRATGKPKFEERLRRLANLDSDPSPVRPSAASLLAALSREYFTLGRKVISQPTGARLHQLRLATKRLRYAIEVFADLAPAATKRPLRAMKKLQDLLGDINDGRATKELLGKRATVEHRELFRERFARLRDEFVAYWKNTFDAEGAEAAWLDALAQGLAKSPETAARSETAAPRRRPSS